MTGEVAWRWESVDKTQEAAVDPTDDGGLVLYVNDGGDAAAVTLSPESARFLAFFFLRWAGS